MEDFNPDEEPKEPKEEEEEGDLVGHCQLTFVRCLWNNFHNVSCFISSLLQKLLLGFSFQ